MHQKVEFGVVAHWRYKEGEETHSSFIVQMVEWARWMLTWKSEIMDTKLQLSPQDAGMRPPFPFPSHKYGFPHMDKLCIPPCGTNDNLLVIMLEEDKVSVVFIKTPYYDLVASQSACFEIDLLTFYRICMHGVLNFYHNINFMNKGFLISIKQMSLQELPPSSIVKDFLDKTAYGSSLFTSYGLPLQEKLMPRVNHKIISDPCQKLKMDDLVALNLSIPQKFFTEYRKEIS